MPLPTFLIGGAKKAGTTALAQYMSQHPEVIMTRPKETGFFQDNYSKGGGWFEQYVQHHDGEQEIGEGSVHTLWNPKSPERIHETTPEARLIFLLRNPIERLYSHYYYDLRCGHLDPSTSFQEVIYERETPRHDRMVKMGFYEEQLARFEPLFGDQMLVLLTDDLGQDTEATVMRALAFVGVDPSRVAGNFEPQNKTQHLRYRAAYAGLRAVWKPLQSLVESLFPSGAERLRSLVRSVLSQGDRPPMPKDDRLYLRDLYHETIRRVEERKGRDLSHWN